MGSPVTQHELPTKVDSPEHQAMTNNAGAASVSSKDPTTPNSKRLSESSPATTTASPGTKPSDKRSKKRRKVNHACVYCQRSHMTCDQQRPCTRCIKRSIGHLCHDEPREPHRKSKSESDGHVKPAIDGTTPREPADQASSAPVPPPALQQGDVPLNLTPQSLPAQSLAARDTVQASSDVQAQDFGGQPDPPCLGYNEWANPNNGTSQDPLSDMHQFHSNYMFNTSELSNEYSLLNDFLSNSLIEDAFYQQENSANQPSGMFSDPSLANTMGPLSTPNGLFATSPQPNYASLPQHPATGTSTPRQTANFPNEKAREIYFMTASDPAGTDTAEERMNKLLKAKYDAGMLKPFNYVGGYARLNQWMEKNLHPNSKDRIVQQFNRFRPKFRERTQKLTDIELVLVEMWFERRLMEYDRVFASMAIPACCWRRTGEIFRGNREMSELIKVPLDQLRDGKLALHMILVEDSLVSYWEKFCAIAFDPTQKAILTSCVLKSQSAEQRCCFSFTVLRDMHTVPALIVGNFLPIPKTQQETN